MVCVHLKVSHFFLCPSEDSVFEKKDFFFFDFIQAKIDQRNKSLCTQLYLFLVNLIRHGCRLARSSSSACNITHI